VVDRGAAGGLQRAVAGRLCRNVGFAVGGWTLALYAATFVVVRRYYVDHLPHYDSVGSYAHLFSLVNQLHERGLTYVLVNADTSSMSWLQPTYTLLLAWAPIKAPEWLVSQNFVLLLGAQAAIVAYARTFGFSRRRQVVLALLPLLPGALYPWDGGIQDLRRDVELALLALAVLFLALAYVAAPSWPRGLALGLLVGLAQWSRDNAAAIILIVTLPPIALAVIYAVRSGSVARLARLALLPLAVFLLLALPYYGLTLEPTIWRFTSSVWGVGEDRVESLLAFWSMPASVLLGGDRRLGGDPRVAATTLAMLAGGVLTIGLLWRAGAVTVDPRRLCQPASLPLLAGGAWVTVAVVLYNSLLLGYGARWHAMPFLPIYVGLVAILAGLAGLVERAPTAPGWLVPLVVGGGCALVAASVPLRMVLGAPPAVGSAGVAEVRAATVEIAERAQGRPIAFLWHDGFGRHHARYYSAQADRPLLAEYEYFAVANGDPIDLDQPIRPGDQPAELRARLDRTIRRWADYAFVCTDTTRYADAEAILWPYQVGRPVVEGLMADPDWRPVAHFTLLGRPFVLLENHTDRSGRPSTGGPSELDLRGAGGSGR
jgi:hypothetical protein